MARMIQIAISDDQVQVLKDECDLQEKILRDVRLSLGITEVVLKEHKHPDNGKPCGLAEAAEAMRESMRREQVLLDIHRSVIAAANGEKTERNPEVAAEAPSPVTTDY